MNTYIFGYKDTYEVKADSREEAMEEFNMEMLGRDGIELEFIQTFDGKGKFVLEEQIGAKQ